jgi:hypothetical protein
MGFYQGCFDVWKAAIEKDGNAFTGRAQRNVHQFHEQLLAYVLLNPQDARIQALSTLSVASSVLLCLCC